MTYNVFHGTLNLAHSYLCLQEKFCCDIVRIIQYNAELTDESVAYTSHVASASARALFTKVSNHTRVYHIYFVTA